ncbi:interferon-inducible double-stranded RNA-dependent protein kinase activator A homolog isoform X2 [Galendromus occidentalis]|uniref:Interferon-inducible double-stranded RNA-dependent protein kinase activator A homolog isoform X2 n=1 Tax=Galendromus occidentalis TaxID=34638 RepID=A0AAJ7L581_9ACAR|nr:interferon-inducible double-stranded RNA-dependent protein kinase activator A homolog isoform X2 [Galendromus occidentalis]
MPRTDRGISDLSEDGEAWEELSVSETTEEAISAAGQDSVAEAASVVGATEPAAASPNPIGELQELCVQRHWALPEYKEEFRTGPPHVSTFVMTCAVQNLSSSGSATTKKSAKKAAAAAMLAKVTSISQEFRIRQSEIWKIP